MPTLNKDAFERTERAVIAVETRFNDLSDPDTEILHQGGESEDQTIVGVLAADLTYRTSTGANCTVKTGAPGSETGSDTIKVYDWLLASGKKLASGGNVIATKIGGYYYVVASSACPVNA